jgi:hypothetical protein
MTAEGQAVAAAFERARTDLGLEPATPPGERVEEPKSASATYQIWLSRHLKGPSLARPTDRASVQAEIERLDRRVEQMESRKKHAPSELDLARAERRIENFEAQAAALRSSLEPHPEASDGPTCRRCGAPIDDDDAYFNGRHCLHCRPSSSDERTSK